MYLANNVKIQETSNMTVADQYNRLLAFVFLKQATMHYEACYREDIKEYKDLLIKQQAEQGASEREMRLYTEYQLPKLTRRYGKICKDNLDKMYKFEASFERRMTEEQKELAEDVSCDVGDIVRDVLETGAFKEVQELLNQIKEQSK